MSDPITNRDTLIAALVETLVDADIAAKAPRYIQMVESEVNRRLFNIEAEVTATTTTVDGDNTLAFPSQFKRLKSIRIGTDPTTVLKQLSVDDLDTQWADANDARPENYAIADGQFKLGPAPDDEYTAQIVYVQGVSALSATNTTNWLLDDHPDAYFYGALIHAELDGWNDERVVSIFVPGFDRILGQIQQADAIKRKGDLVGDVPGTYF